MVSLKESPKAVMTLMESQWRYRAVWSYPPIIGGTSEMNRLIPTFLTVPPFNTAPHMVGTPNHKIILLILHNYNFVTVMTYNVDIWHVTSEGVVTYRLRTPVLAAGHRRV